MLLVNFMTLAFRKGGARFNDRPNNSKRCTKLYFGQANYRFLLIKGAVKSCIGAAGAGEEHFGMLTKE